MNVSAGRPGREPQATLEERVLALEHRVAALAEALRVLAHGLEDLPAAEPRGQRAAEAARQAHDLLLVAGERASEPDSSPAPDRPRGQLPPFRLRWPVRQCCCSRAAT